MILHQHNSVTCAEEILLEIGVCLNNWQSLKRKERVYYRNIAQCLTKIKSIGTQEEVVDLYDEVIRYLCQIRNFAPIQTILRIPLTLHDTLIPFSDYLLIKGFAEKLAALCLNILDSFVNEGTNLLEIEFLLAKAKSVSLDRVLSYQIFEKVHQKFITLNRETEDSLLLYLESLLCLSNAKLGIGKYREALLDLRKCLQIINESLFYFSHDYESKIDQLKADVLAQMAWLAMVKNNFHRSLVLFKEAQNLYMHYNLKHKLIGTLVHQGVINRKIRNYDLSLKYLDQAKEVASSINFRLVVAWIDHHKAYVFLNQGQHELAQALAEKSIKEAYIEEKDDMIGDFHEQLGLIKLGKSHIDEAIDSLQLSLFFRQKIGNSHGIASSYKHLSLAYLKSKRYIKAYQCIKQCLTIFYKLKVLNFTRLYRIGYLFFNWIILGGRWTA